MVALTFPDGARREYPRRHLRSRHRQGHFAVARQAHGRDGARRRGSGSVRGDRAPTRKIEFLNREDPRALELIRHDCAHVLAEAVQSLVAGHAGDHRPGDRERLLLRLLPQRAVHARRSAGDREEDARDHRARQTVHHGSLVARRGQAACSATRASCSRSSWSTPSPADQQIKIYKQGDWFDLCRGPHMTSTGKVGNAFKLMKVAGAYWRGDSNREMLSRIYGTAFAKQEELDALSQADGGGREARPSQARPRDGPVSFPGGGARHRVLARQGLDHLPGDRRYMRRRLQGDYAGGQRAATARQVAVGDVRPLGLVPREHVPGDLGRRRHRGRARLRDQADELPRPHPDLQARPASPTAICRCGWRNSASCTATSRPARCTGCCACAPSRRTTRMCSAPKSRWPTSASRSTT